MIARHDERRRVLAGADGGRHAPGVLLPPIGALGELPCELGGGIRDEVTICELLDLGLARLVIGTKALREPDWFRGIVREFPDKLALGIDARDGLVATDG